MPPIRVLVVDDEFSVRSSLGGYLEDRDFDVFLAASGEESLEVLKKRTVDCTIVDIRLPGMDGNQFIRKAHQLQPSLIFLIYTGSTAYEVLPYMADIGIGAEDVFHKPLTDMGVIVDTIRRRTRERGASDDR